MKRKYLGLALALFAVPAMADSKAQYCADLSIRYTIFATSAILFNDKQEYISYHLRMMDDLNADRESRNKIFSLLEAAWNTKQLHNDIRNVAFRFFSSCNGENQT
jgi:hypothetical protein